MSCIGSCKEQFSSNGSSPVPSTRLELEACGTGGLNRVQNEKNDGERFVFGGSRKSWRLFVACMDGTEFVCFLSGGLTLVGCLVGWWVGWTHVGVLASRVGPGLVGGGADFHTANLSGSSLKAKWVKLKISEPNRRWAFSFARATTLFFCSSFFFPGTPKSVLVLLISLRNHQKGLPSKTCPFRELRFLF